MDYLIDWLIIGLIDYWLFDYMIDGLIFIMGFKNVRF